MHAALLGAAAASLSAAGALAQFSPSGNYTPSVVACPSNHSYVRPAASGLSTGETEWLAKRSEQVVDSLETYLTNVGVAGLDVDAYIEALGCNSSDVPVIGLTFSGGGTRSELSNLGLYQALDERYDAAVKAKTGGLLQATTYVAGLSGGALALVGPAVNGFPPLTDIIDNGNLNSTYEDAALAELVGKAKLGYTLTLADVLGILSGYHVLTPLNGTAGDPLGFTWSGIQQNAAFANGSTPLPIIMTVEVVPEGLPGSDSYQSANGSILMPLSNATTVYEYTPFEFGSWTGRVQAFTDLQYFGTPLYDGQPYNSTICIEGYDTAAFVLGTAISALNYWIAETETNGTVGQFAKRHTPETNSSSSSNFVPYPVDEDKTEQARQVATLSPTVLLLPEFESLLSENETEIIYGKVRNPFWAYTNGVDEAAASQEQLWLVDGSETGQVNPIWPLIQPERNLDFLIVSDACGSELSSGWMNGTNFRNTYLAANASGIPFPEIPSVNTLINLGYTSRPTFFGCNDPTVPLVLYAADFPYTAYTNTSGVSDVPFTTSQLLDLTSNALPLISQDSDRLRANWTSCLACGAIYRSLERLEWDIPEVCKGCMSDYCWNGTVDDSTPSFLEPSLVLNSSLTFEEWNATVFY